MKKQIISESKLREIIKEEALRMKKRVTLENEKKTLIKKLNEMYMEDNSMEESITGDIDMDYGRTNFSKDDYVKGLGDMTKNLAQEIKEPLLKALDATKMGLLKKSLDSFLSKLGLSATDMPSADEIKDAIMSKFGSQIESKTEAESALNEDVSDKTKEIVADVAVGTLGLSGIVWGIISTFFTKAGAILLASSKAAAAGALVTAAIPGIAVAAVIAAFVGALILITYARARN
jgi:hypothetical protein